MKRRLSVRYPLPQIPQSLPEGREAQSLQLKQDLMGCYTDDEDDNYDSKVYF